MNYGENKGAKTGKEGAVRISLIDVVYGVVLAYGFSFIDAAERGIDYARFTFAYLIIIIDWIYVHTQYWGWEYKYNSIFVLDVCILFSFSRLTCTSISGDPTYWLWLSILFLLYSTWDVISHVKGMPSEYDWRYSLVGDSFGCLAYLAFFVFAARGLESSDSRILIGALIYPVAIVSWFVKNRSADGNKVSALVQ